MEETDCLISSIVPVIFLNSELKTILFCFSSSINDNKNYVENFEYSKNIIVGYWQDDRYLDPQELKDDAIDKLKVLSIPARSYGCNITDLSRTVEELLFSLISRFLNFLKRKIYFIRILLNQGLNFHIRFFACVSIVYSHCIALHITNYFIYKIFTSFDICINGRNFNDGSWEGDFNVDSTPETRIRNMYGYALLLKNGTLKQSIQITNGTYTLSFIYKKLINLANVKVTVNGEEILLSNSDYTEFKHTVIVTTNSIEIEFVSDTDN